MSMTQQVCFQPVGRVINRGDPAHQGKDFGQQLSRLEIYPAYRDALTGAAPGQTLLVLYYFHMGEEGGPLIQHPRGDSTRTPRGVFLLRSPDRPNRIGVTEVVVERVREDGLTVRGLDALPGSPILDIKVVSLGEQDPETSSRCR